MNFESVTPQTQAESLSLSDRIDCLFDNIGASKDLEKLQQLQDGIKNLQQQLFSEFGITSLRGIPAWEKLIGGSEIDVQVDESIVAQVTVRIEEFVSQFEATL